MQRKDLMKLETCSRSLRKTGFRKHNTTNLLRTILTKLKDSLCQPFPSSMLVSSFSRYSNSCFSAFSDSSPVTAKSSNL